MIGKMGHMITYMAYWKPKLNVWFVGRLLRKKGLLSFRISTRARERDLLLEIEKNK